MNQHAKDLVGMPGAGIEALDSCQVPRVTIAAYCETQAAADTMAAAAADRRMARATVDARVGGIAQAIELYRDTPSPDLLVLESRASSADLLCELENLAEVCDVETKVMVIGVSNDIMLYSELMDRGIADYLVGPANAPSIIAAIGRIYRDSGSRKLGRTCAFIGAKGGVGASTVAHNVAWTLARDSSLNVVLADMDLPFGTAGLDFNIDAEQGIAEAVEDSGRLDELLLDRLLVPCNEHLSLLTAPTVLGRSYDFDETAFEQLLEIARARAATVVLDVPHLWTAWARRTLVSADEVVIVAAPDLANLKNTKGIVEFLMQARPNDAPPKLVLNLVGVPKRPEIKLAEFTAAVRLEPIAAIAFNPALFGTAANKGQMVASVSARSPACDAFTEIARVISGRSDAKVLRKGALAARLLNMLHLGGRRPSPAGAHSGARQ
jgi:pilus assembly protein CpaE